MPSSCLASRSVLGFGAGRLGCSPSEIGGTVRYACCSSTVRELSESDRFYPVPWRDRHQNGRIAGTRSENLCRWTALLLSKRVTPGEQRGSRRSSHQVLTVGTCAVATSRVSSHDYAKYVVHQQTEARACRSTFPQRSRVRPLPDFQNRTTT